MIYKIKLIGDYNKNLIEKIQQQHKDAIPGIYGLYHELCAFTKCESYSRERIYYVAYTLAKNNIDFKIEG